jgi:GNAT superfamily N-acetyltransferase
VSTTRIQPVGSRADLRRFIRYPFARYRGDPHWVPPLLVSEREQFDPRKNPFYEHARLNLFLAERNGEVVGRIAAIDDDNHNQTHDGNLLFFGYSEAEFDQLAKEFKMILDPELVALAEVNGELAGVTVLIPDANQVFKRMRGRLLPFGVFHLLRRNRIIDQLRLPILGVAPEHRNKGFELAMIDELYGRVMAKGYQRCEAPWTLADNRAMNHIIEAGGAKHYKTYRVYQKEI